MRKAANTTNLGAILKLAACTLGGALAALVVLAGAVLATCLAFVLVAAQILRPLGARLPRARRKDAEAPIRATVVGRPASI